jgi:hypothetical protein
VAVVDRETEVRRGKRIGQVAFRASSGVVGWAREPGEPRAAVVRARWIRPGLLAGISRRRPACSAAQKAVAQAKSSSSRERAGAGRGGSELEHFTARQSRLVAALGVPRSSGLGVGKGAAQ